MTLPTKSKRTPLRELFPTQNGRRVKTCPNCGQRSMAYYERVGGYRCLNISQGCSRTVYPG